MKKRDNIEKLEQLTKTLREDQLDDIAKAQSKLLGETFLVSFDKDDAVEFHAANAYFDIIESYMALINVELRRNPENTVIYIKNEAAGNRFNLSKLETILLLIIRKIDFNLLSKPGVSARHMTRVSEIKEVLDQTEIYSPGEIKATRFASALNRLKGFKLIDFNSGRGFSDQTAVEIYPTISLVVSADSVEALAKTLNAYKGSEEETYETSED